MTTFDQISIFDIGKTPLKIDKPIRLIELFAGIGSQAKALERLGADFEHYRVCEFDKYAIKSYNAIHGTDFATSDITQITASDLGIVDTDKYCYIMTYSFPCQDLSLAGLQKGMAKGGNTRSGLLWEVERLLNECEELPQILLMENVTQVHGTKNLEHFRDWIEFLESKGYSNYWEDLNAKNYGIPQNRNRTFMVSVLGDYTYEFPKPIPLELRLKDMLEGYVDRKYYLLNKALEYIQKRVGNYTQICDENTEIAKSAITAVGNANWTGNFVKEPPILIGGMQKHQSVKQDGISTTLTSSMGTGGGYVPMIAEEPSVKQIGNLFESKSRENPNQGRLYDKDGLSPTLGAMQGGNRQPFIVDEPTINKIDIPQTVKVRKYDVDCKQLCALLRSHKKSSGNSNQDIADHLNVPLTKVEHWFRQDKCFAIPDEDIWLELKAMLGIDTDEFDKAIMTFEEKKNVFEKSNRCYISDGLSPTITSASADEKIIEPLAYDEQNGYIRKDGTVGTLTTDGSSPKHNNRVIEDMRIRKLTPKECWRLMGFDDNDFDKAAQHNSNAQLYKQAGNSIVVDVLVAIFKNMF